MAREGSGDRVTVRVLVPLRRPRAVRVLEAGADMAELGVARWGDRLALEGALRCRVAYVGTDRAVRTREQRVLFFHQLPAASADGQAPPGVRVAAVDCALRYREGRAFGDAADLAVHLALEPPGERDGEAVPEAARRPQPASALLQVEELVGEAWEEVLEAAEVLLDLAAFKVIDVQCEVADLKAQALAGAVVMEGRLWEQIYYVAEDGLIHYQHAEVPFEHALALACAPGLNARAQAQVRALDFELTQDGRLLAQKISLRLQARATRAVELELLTGLDAPGVEVTRDRVRVDRVVGFASARTLERRTSRLPTPAGEIVKVVAAVGEARPQVLAGQVLVEGVMRQQVFYTTAGTSYHFDEEVPFGCVLDLPGAAPGMQAQVEARVEEASARLSADGREVEREALVVVGARVTEPATLEVVTAVSGEGVEAESRRLRLERLVGQTTGQVMLQKRAPLVSRALGIARIVGTIRELQCEVIPDQVIVQGVLHQQVFYVDWQRVERYQTEDLPFTHLVDLPGVLPGMTAEVHPRLKHLSHALAPEGNAFAEKAVVELGVRVVEAMDLQAVSRVRLPERAAPAPAGGEPVACDGFVLFPWPFAAGVREVRPALAASAGDGGGFDALRVHAYYLGPNAVVYHAGGEFPVPGGRRAIAVREFRWFPVEIEAGRYEGVRWEAVLQCASPST